MKNIIPLKPKPSPAPKILAAPPLKSPVKPAPLATLPPSSGSLWTDPTHQEIATLAAALWRNRGCPPARDEEIWLEAERRLVTDREKPLDFDSGAVMGELDDRFPGPSGRSATSL